MRRAPSVSSLTIACIATAVLFTLLPDVASAQQVLQHPTLCDPQPMTTGTSTILTGASSPLNYILNGLDRMSTGIFQSCGQAGIAIATVLGTFETLWFVVQTVVWKHRIEEMLKDMMFKTMTCLTVIALIVGLSGASAPGVATPIEPGGAIVKEIAFGFFSGVAQNAVNQLYPGGNPVSQISSTSIGSSMTSASNGILQNGIEAGDIIINCPATIYWSKHGSKDNFLGDILNVVKTVASLPFVLSGFVLGISVVVFYVLIDVLLVATMVDGLLVLAVGVFTLGFANSRWTADNAAPYFRLIFAVGWKVFSYVFIANLGVYLIDATVTSEIDLATTVGLDWPALPIGGDFGLLIVMILIGIMVLGAGNISKALSAGSFSVGVGGAATARALEFAYIAYAVGSGGAGAATGAAAKNGIAKAGGSAGSGGGGGGVGGGPRPVPNLPQSIKSHAQSGIEHETTGGGISFRPHGN
jgi:hypothetical protein